MTTSCEFFSRSIAAAGAALLLAGAGGADAADEPDPSSPSVVFGVSDDRGKYDDDGGEWFFSELRQSGLSANKMTVNWDPAKPLEIREKPFFDRSIPWATAQGIHLSFGIHIGKARAITSSPRTIDQFVEWLQLVARTYPEVTEFVVGNEPNLTRFWQPQFDRRGRGASGIAFASFLARSYDALKAVNPEITVVGVGLSPRGNDMPRAKSNISTSPVKFIRDLGIGYRRAAPRQADHGRVRLPSVPARATATRSRRATGGRTRASRTSTGSSRRSGTRSTGPPSRSSRKSPSSRLCRLCRLCRPCRPRSRSRR